jgi:hypothetical protein
LLTIGTPGLKAAKAAVLRKTLRALSQIQLIALRATARPGHDRAPDRASSSASSGRWSAIPSTPMASVWGDIAIGLGTGLVAGVVTGLVTGAGLWLLVTKTMTPDIVISSEISQTGDGEFRVKLVNLRRRGLPHWPALDVQVSAQLRVQGVDPRYPKRWNRYSVPIRGGGRAESVETNRLFRLCPDEIDLPHRPKLAAVLKEADVELSDLAGLLKARQGIEVRVAASAAHAYTHGTSRAEARYTANDVQRGVFRAAAGRAGLILVDESESTGSDVEE